MYSLLLCELQFTCFGFSCRNFKNRGIGVGITSIHIFKKKKKIDYRLIIYKKAISDTGQSQVNYNQNLKTLKKKMSLPMLWAFRNNFYQMIWIECRKIFVVEYVLDLTAVNEHSSAPASEPHPRRARGSGSNRGRPMFYHSLGTGGVLTWELIHAHAQF